MQNPYASFLDSLEKPARYIGGEHFIIRKTFEEMTGQRKTKVQNDYISNT